MQLPPGNVFHYPSALACERRLPKELPLRARRLNVAPTSFILSASIREQRMDLFAANLPLRPTWDSFLFTKRYLISTSRFGIGEKENSNCTPRGLHKVGRKVGGGWPVGTAFKSRLPIGSTWQGMPNAPIAHRILWLEGLEPGFNRGEGVDTFKRYVYIHGLGNEPSLGRPDSHGCIHLSASDIMPLYDRLPEGTLVWIQP